jgi:hypothetical protein
LDDEEMKEDLEGCISKCNRKDEWADFRGVGYEELLEQFHNKKRRQKPDYGCPKCVKYVPARHLVKVPDIVWGLKPRTTTPAPPTTTPTPSSTPIVTSTTAYTDSDDTSFTPPVPTRSVRCGLRNVYGETSSNLFDPANNTRFQDNNIVFGNKTNHGEFPWQVSFRDKEQFASFCGGTLINSWTVVTAAHCLYEGKGGYPLQDRFIVALGWQRANGGNRDIDEKDKKFGEQIINIDLRPGREKGKVIIHQDYLGTIPDAITNVYSPHDIAIVVLSEEVWFPENADKGLWDDDHNWSNQVRGSFVRPICMPPIDKTRQIGIKALNPFTIKKSARRNRRILLDFRLR